jgi:predicted dehydrogenase
MNPSHADRRQFMTRAAAFTSTLTTLRWHAPTFAQDPTRSRESRSPNEKLNIGCIGVAAQGEYNLNNVASENIVALCDIDAQRLGKAAERFPKAEKYADYRKLLDRTDLDAVVIATPDHSHAIPAIRALKQGLDVYCEKPLTHTVHEARRIRELTAQHQAITQMGTQIHAGDNYRRAVEIVQSGILGPVRRVHVWMGNTMKSGRRVAQGTAPDYVDYDLWTGPAPLRPFDPSHFHFNWRFWWDFGNGTLGDFGCHYMDLPFWALKLRYPISVEALGEKSYEGDNEPPDNLRVDYQFPARDELPPVHLTWYHGNRCPDWIGPLGKGSGVLFEGDHARLLADYGSRQLLVGDDRHLEAPAPTIPNSIGHHQEWIQACKTRGATTCNFDYSGALTESVLLGNVSYRAGQRHLVWQGEELKVTNCPEAQALLTKEYRAGWALES